MSVRVGIIAEDHSDVTVLAELLKKAATKKYSIRSFVGNGCGKILAKCAAWARVLRDQGCTRLLLVHDLDTRSLANFRHQLMAALAPCPIPTHVILIPVREIEAWLLADQVALGVVARASRPPKQIANPEALLHPKEELREVLRRLSAGRLMYVNTVHNRRIAAAASLPSLRRCRSFQPLEAFAINHLR